MKLKDIFIDKSTKVFVVTNQESENELEWIIEPTSFELIPEEEQIYFVVAKLISPTKTIECYIGIVTPERIADAIIKQDEFGHTIIEDLAKQDGTVIPLVASECYGDYELYYSKENPQIGIDILKAGLNKAKNINVVAQDLGYVLRDENRIEEAIEAFKISEGFGPTSEYVYLELSRLYKELRLVDKQHEYEEKFKTNGGTC